MSGLQNEQAEKAIIARLLIEPGQLARVAGKLAPQDFATSVYRSAFREMLNMQAAGTPIDHITLAAAGVALPDTLDVVAAARGGSIESHAQLVRESAFRREIFGHATRVAAGADEGQDPTELLAEVAKLGQVVAHGDTKLVDSTRAADLYLDEMVRRREQGVGLDYGIPALDAMLQPAHGGDMIVIAARPSMGKTILAETIIEHWAGISRLPVLFISVEMSLAQLLDRAVSREANIRSSDIVRGTITADEEVLARETIERRRSVNIWYEDNPNATSATVSAAASRVALEAGGLGGIAVDYLQILKDPGDNDNQRISRVSRSLKAIAREHNAPMLALSQLNRQSELRPDPHPKLSDLRDSGAIEQDADAVLGLYRDREAEIEGLPSMMDIDILKNRQGPANVRVQLPFHGDYVRIAK